MGQRVIAEFVTYASTDYVKYENTFCNTLYILSALSIFIHLINVKEIPCDLDLQSNAVEDRCGVCRGDGTSCDVVRGEKAMFCVGMVAAAEKQIMTIPAGAVNVKIEEMLPSETRIQVRDNSGRSIYIDG